MKFQNYLQHVLNDGTDQTGNYTNPDFGNLVLALFERSNPWLFHYWSVVWCMLQDSLDWLRPKIACCCTLALALLHVRVSNWSALSTYYMPKINIMQYLKHVVVVPIFWRCLLFWTVCELGYFGNLCDQVCHCRRQAPCDRVTGKCLNECEEKWFGTTCSNSKYSTLHTRIPY